MGTGSTDYFLALAPAVSFLDFCNRLLLTIYLHSQFCFTNSVPNLYFLSSLYSSFTDVFSVKVYNSILHIFFHINGFTCILQGLSSPGHSYKRLPWFCQLNGIYLYFVPSNIYIINIKAILCCNNNQPQNLRDSFLQYHTGGSRQEN